MIMWDPETYPDVEDLEDLRDLEVSRSTSSLAKPMQKFSLLKVCCRQIRLILHTTQPLPASLQNRVAIAQQGFASSEPYAYKNVYEEWGKDVAITLLNDNGFPIYSQTIAIKPSMKDEMDAC